MVELNSAELITAKVHVDVFINFVDETDCIDL